MNPRINKTRNNLPENNRREIVDLLNQNLADILDLSLQAKQAHWNVKGPHFIGLHELFDTVAEDLAEFADGIAERAVQLGGIALGTIQIISKASSLPAYPLDLRTGSDHAEALSKALAKFSAAARLGIDAADSAGDAVTADLFTEVSRGTDKLLWMVDAHLQADR
jgi:starvation-inducible DNA-binding protein